MENMANRDDEQRIAELREELRYHNYLYYVENDPKINDGEYDELFNELVELEERHPELATEVSPTQRVGAQPADEFETAEHTAQMLSLDSSADTADFRRFDERIRKTVDEPSYSLEPKIDGLSIEIVYRNGSYERAVTRGDGVEGEVVTENVRTIRSVPLRLREEERKAPGLLAVRGEVFMHISAFEDLNERLINDGKEPFANPRNAAAGSIRQLDPAIPAQRPLRLFAYDILHQEDGTDFTEHHEVLDALAQWALPVVPERSRATDADAVLARFEAFSDMRDDLDFEVDGLVVKLDDLVARKQLGATSRHPRWAYAIKFPARQEITTVQRIIPSIGRTGIVTPIALMRPVNIGGVTVSRASLHNVELLREKDVREGDKVRIQRAGDVIPQVVEVVERGDDRSDPFEMPDRCPSCDTELVRRGPYLVCPNSFGCPAQLKGRIEHFASRNALDIEGLGEKVAGQLIESGKAETIADIFELTAEQLEELELFGKRRAQNLVDAIEKGRHTTLSRFLHGLAIPEVGPSTARDLARHYGDLDAVRSASVEEIASIHGFGETMAEAIHGFFQEPRNQEVLDELESHVDLSVEVQEAGNALDGLVFVFTGSLDSLTRSEAKQLVERFGGKATSSVSSNTDFVIAGAGGGSKLDEAQEHDVTVLDEDGFYGFLRDKGTGVERDS